MKPSTKLDDPWSANRIAAARLLAIGCEANQARLLRRKADWSEAYWEGWEAAVRHRDPLNPFGDSITRGALGGRETEYAGWEAGYTKGLEDRESNKKGKPQ